MIIKCIGDVAFTLVLHYILLIRYLLSGSSEDPLDPLLSAPTLDELNQLVVWQVAAEWYQVGVFLDVRAAVLNTIKKDHHNDSVGACENLLNRWLSREPGTGKQDRVWLSVLEAVKEAMGKEVAGEIERELIPLASSLL